MAAGFDSPAGDYPPNHQHKKDTTMTTITEVSVQSFMGIDEATFPVVDGVNVVAGENGSGKTSAVAAILWALAGRRGAVDRPVKIGADKATVRVFAVGEFEFEITRTQTGDKSSLKVKRDGAPIASPQKALDAMIGALAFDPIEFASMKPADQVKTLLEAFDADIDLDALDAEHADLAAARVAVGRDRDKAKGHAASIEVPEGAPDTPVSVGAAVDALRNAEANNAAYERTAMAIAEIDTEIETLEQRLTSLHEGRKGFTRDLESSALIDTAPLAERVDNAERLNAAHRAKVAKAEAEAEAAKHATEWAYYDDKMKENRQARADAVASIGVPISGFDLTDEGVTIDGVPLGQVNTAGQITVGAAVLAATARDMRIMWIKAGSLLDDASMAAIRTLADEHGLQVFVERVGSEPGAIELRGGYLAEVV